MKMGIPKILRGNDKNRANDNGASSNKLGRREAPLQEVL